MRTPEEWLEPHIARTKNDTLIVELPAAISTIEEYAREVAVTYLHRRLSQMYPFMTSKEIPPEAWQAYDEFIKKHQ